MPSVDARVAHDLGPLGQPGDVSDVHGDVIAVDAHVIDEARSTMLRLRSGSFTRSASFAPVNSEKAAALPARGWAPRPFGGRGLSGVYGR